MKKWIAVILTIMLMAFPLAVYAGEQSDEEPYTVTFVIGGTTPAGEERVEEAINKILEEELNAHLDLVLLPWANLDQQKQLMLSGDEKVDVMCTGFENAVQYMRAGQIVDMSELVEKYGTNVKEIFGDEVIDVNRYNEFLLGLPNQKELGNVPCVLLRKDIVEKYNIDLSQIKEPKDLEKVFEVVQAGEPDMTMLYSTANENNAPARKLFMGEEVTNFCALEDGDNSTVIENYYGDWYEETVSMLYDWYQKGYISKDAGTSTEDWRVEFQTGNTFSIFYRYHPGVPVEFSSATGYEFEAVMFRDYPIISKNDYGAIIFSIAQNCENPEKTMQVLDFIYGSPEVMNLLNWGEEGIDYVFEDEANGIINFPEGISLENAEYCLNMGWELPNQFIAHKWSGATPNMWEEYASFNSTGKRANTFGFTFDNEEWQNQEAVLVNVVSQYTGALNSGTADPEVYLAEFEQALKDAGIDEYVAAVQQQFDEWKAAQN